MSIDFTKAEIGQKVTCLMHGKGIITSISNGISYPIIVDFENYGVCTYTEDGRRYLTANPTLIAGHIELPKIDQGELPKPKKEPKPLEWKGIPVWAYVSGNNNSGGDKSRCKRRVICYSDEEQRFYAVSFGDDLHLNATITPWKYAWEIEDD